jgi:hypothetical protein
VANGYYATFMMALAIEAAGNDGCEGLSEHLRNRTRTGRSDPARLRAEASDPRRV